MTACNCVEDVVCRACMTSVEPPALSAPPADDVREALASLLWAHSYDGGHGLMSGEQFAAMVREALEAVLATFEVRPRGTVTDAEVHRAQEGAGERGAFLQDWEVRAVLEAARLP